MAPTVQTTFPYFAQTKQHVESILQYTFHDDSLLKEALWRSGEAHLGPRHLTQNNDRMALVGLAVMRTALMRHAYNQNHDRGFMHQQCEHLLSNTNLAVVGKDARFKLDKLIVLNPGTTAVHEKVMATTVEALLGAVFEDSGMDMAAVMTSVRALELI